MRILVVGAITGGTIPIGRAVYSAFKALNQQAEFIDFTDYLPEFTRVKASGDKEQSYKFLLKCQVRLMENVAAFGPDVILGISQSPLTDSETLSRLRRAGIRLCYWFVEDYKVFDYWKTFAPVFDHFFTIQKEPFWDRLKQIGSSNFHYLPTGFDDSLECLTPDTPEINISFMGAPYLNRVHYFSRLNRPDFHIFGQDWDVVELPSVVVGDRRITETESREIYGRSRININLHSSQVAESFGKNDFVNPRTFELAGMGAFQLVDMTSLLPLHFDPETEIVACKRWEDMESAIDYYLEHDDERIEIAKKSRARVLKEHTYKHRTAEILSILK